MSSTLLLTRTANNPMPLIIDTYNVLHTTGILPPEMAGIDVGGLIRLISSSRYQRQLVTLVCDGTGPMTSSPTSPRLIAVRFAGPGREADDLIRELIDAASDRRRITVVTSDRAVATAARKRRCRTITSQAFLGHLLTDAQTRPKPLDDRPTGPLDKKRVDQWIEQFGVDETDPTKPAAADPPGGDQTLPPAVIRQAEELLDRDPDDAASPD